MSTGGSLSARSLPTLPAPRVNIHPRGKVVGSHWVATVGGAGDVIFEAYRDLNLSVWLWRYKRGFSAPQLKNTGFRYDNDRGFRHPSDFMNGTVVGRAQGGGAHTHRGNGNMPPRPSEVLVASAVSYDFILQPELWFTRNANLLAYPVGTDITPQGTIWGLGANGQGQGGGMIDGAIREDSGVWIDRKPHRLIQDEFFKFSFAHQNPKNAREWIHGPLTPTVKASVFPRMYPAYSYDNFGQPRGRLIRLSIV